MGIKLCSLLMLVLIAGSCSDVDAANHCVAIELHSSAECGHDGKGIACKFDFIQPEKWGRCGMQRDESLLCEKDGMIAHHPYTAIRPDWTIPANSCSVLHEEIEKHGQGPYMRIEIESRGPKERQQ